jgi:hypothetical protein
MAKPKKDIYVEVGQMSSAETEADPKLKKEMPAVMKEAAADLIKKTKGITSTKPNDKKDKAYAIAGTLTGLKKEPKGKEAVLSCAVSMVLTEWPSGKMVTGRLEGSAKTNVPTEQSEKQLKGVAEACVAAAVSGATESALSYILSENK